MNEKAKRVVWTLVRIVSALAIGHVGFFCLMWLLPLMTGVEASEIGCLCLSALAFYMLRVRHWHFWVAVVIGVVLWGATMGVHVYTDPLYDGACGYTRYIGLPLPAHRVNECSSGFSAMFDGKPGRSVLRRLRACRCAAHGALVPGSMAQSQEMRHHLCGGFVGCCRVGNCLPAGNRRELVRTSELAVAPRL